jgi:hypothetical protein
VTDVSAITALLGQFARSRLQECKSPAEHAEITDALVLCDQVSRQLLPPETLRGRLRDTAYRMSFNRTSPVIAACCDLLAQAYEKPGETKEFH